jgi:hypothetical protein
MASIVNESASGFNHEKCAEQRKRGGKDLLVTKRGERCYNQVNGRRTP